MDKSLSAIISAERADSRNGDTDSIADIDFVRYNQFAQDRLVSLIATQHSWVFIEKVDIPIVAGTSLYSLNRNVLFGTRLVQVEYSYNGLEANFQRLMPTPNRYQRVTGSGRPIYYRRTNGQVEVEPVPASTEGTLRVTYERQRDRVDIKRAKVSGTPSGTTINILGYLDPVPSITTETSDILTPTNQKHVRHICICDPDGTRILTNGVISSYSAGVITLAANVSTYLEAGKALVDLANNLVTSGKYSSTHSELPNECERYFIEYTNRRVMTRDSSVDWNEVDTALKEIELDIVNSFKIPDKDVKPFPISDSTMLIPGYE